MTPKPTRRTILRYLASAAAYAASPRLRAQPDEMLHDPLRPSFHYLPAKNWMNDPCAPIFWQGQYHLFHQYNPHAAVWGDMHWYHATSPDLVHWTRRGTALAPMPGSADSDGCFTGSAVLHDGRPAILYTGIQSVPHAQATLSDGTHNFRETQILAQPSNPELTAWTRNPSAPVIPVPPDGMPVTGFRDPCPFQIPGRPGWFAIIGSGIRGVGGNVLLYSSPDLKTWTYLHPLAQGKASGSSATDPVDSGEMWECPDFFLLDADGKAKGDTWVLIHSTERKTLWQTGRLDSKTLLFNAEHTGELDYGRDNLARGGKGAGTFYAPKTQLDKDGRRILWGWLPETRPEAEYSKAGWSGMMSLPRSLSLGMDGQVLQRPAPQAAMLRRGVTGLDQQEHLATLRQVPVNTLTSPAAHTQSDSQGILLRIEADPKQDPLVLSINRVEISLDKPLSPNASIHAFFDNSVLELFIDERIAFTHRYYTRIPAVPIASVRVAGSRVVDKPTAYTLQSIWPA